MLKTRQSLIAAILILYFIPIFVMGSYSLRWLSVEQSWSMLSLSVLLASCGSIVIYGFLYLWESNKPAPAASVPPDSRLAELQESLELKSQELEATQEEVARFRKLSEDSDNERLLFRDSLEEQLVEKNHLTEEQAKTIDALQHDLETTRQKVEELEIKTADLSYEIKTLLQLSEMEEPIKEDLFEILDPEPVYEVEQISPLSNQTIRSTQEAEAQLKRCLNIAQKITGYQIRDGRYPEIPVSNAALDLRHLFDNLRCEHSATILFYSKKDEKLLFANNQTKTLLGWSPDKVIQDFEDITLEGSEEWEKATRQTNPKADTQLSLKMRTKQGEPLEIKALIGTIPSGVFRQDLIAILWH